MAWILGIELRLLGLEQVPLEAMPSHWPQRLISSDCILFDIIECESKEQGKDGRAWSSDVD